MSKTGENYSLNALEYIYIRHCEFEQEKKAENIEKKNEKSEELQRTITLKVKKVSSLLEIDVAIAIAPRKHKKKRCLQESLFCVLGALRASAKETQGIMNAQSVAKCGATEYLYDI